MSAWLEIITGVAGSAPWWLPWLAGSASVAAVAARAIRWVGTFLQRIFLVALGLLLVGYAFLDRGFAHVGVGPIYAGEAVLGLGLLSILTLNWRALLRSPLTWLIALFAIWGTLRTLPYLSVYGFDALRDAVIWGYAAFAILVGGVLLRSKGRLIRVVDVYSYFLLLAVIEIPLALLATQVLVKPETFLTASNLPILLVKPGDAAVQLAGAAAFLLLDPRRSDEGHPKGVIQRSIQLLRGWLPWVPWLGGAALCAALSRGGFLAMLVALAPLLLLRPSFRWLRVLLLGVLLVGAAAFTDFRGDLGISRNVSVEQLVANLESVIATGETGEAKTLAGSRTWRLKWWGKIVNYTLYGDYFWSGKGFGVNLADDDGFQSMKDHSLRSPHNGHLTILARSGVVGLAGWILLQGAFALSLLRAYWQANRKGQEFWARLDLWILAYWAAFMVNGAFDVYLEGPAGGIWFWSLFGFGIAALSLQSQGQAGDWELTASAPEG